MIYVYMVLSILSPIRPEPSEMWYDWFVEGFGVWMFIVVAVIVLIFALRQFFRLFPQAKLIK